LKPSVELIAIEYVRSSNHLIAWLKDLINPITCSYWGQYESENYRNYQRGEQSD